MKKVLMLLFALFCFVSKPCFATGNLADELVSLMDLIPRTATKEVTKNLLGKPSKVEEGKKKALWYYEKETSNLVISWNKKSDKLEKLSFTSLVGVKNKFTEELQRKLKSGSTNMIQAIQLLGTPQDMTIKAVTQEMHYAYQKSILRLFFRNQVLVDFTLLIQP